MVVLARGEVRAGEGGPSAGGAAILALVGRVEQGRVGRGWARRRWLLGGAALVACAPTLGSPGPPSGVDAEAMTSAASELAARAPGWPVAEASPFVVTGDLPAAAIEAAARDVIAWAVALLRRDFIDRDPPAAVNVWLFADEASYRRHSLALFGVRPSTPFGYYAAARRDLVINYATGDGTLVHELVHPLLHAAYPAAPPWLDEGLASLFEHCEARAGRLCGLPNWRLPGLQHALRGGQAPSFEALLRSDREAFYADVSGTHYAEARYLLYYLQERGALVEYYRRARAGAALDPSGHDALAALAPRLGHADLGAMRRSWEDFVLALRYP